MQSLLRADNVSYKVKPVSGYMDIKALEATIEDDDDLRSIVMLNCGAIVDVQAMLGLGSGDDDEEESPITCYILDSHRPIHLKNVYANDSEVQVLLGESTDASEYPSGGSDLSDEEDEEIDSDEDEDDMLDDGTVGGKRRRSGGQRRHQRTRCVAPYLAHTRTCAAFLSLPTPLFRTLSLYISLLLLLATSERRRRILSYYERSYFGWPSSFMTYELAKQLNRDRNTQLWYAIVGMTAQYLEGHLDPTEYTTLAQQYSTLVDSKNSAAAKISVPLSAIDDDAAAAAAPGADAAGGGASLSLAASEDGRLTCNEDFRFKLHRHWSLYEAMFYSEYMAPRLGVWKNDGPDRLKQFLARLGVPLDDARQPFKMMKPQMKDRLKENVERHKAEFNLGDIFYGSFHRQCGYEAEADSAADVAYAMAALLECEGETPLVTESTVVESKDGEIDVLQTEEKRRLMRWENSVNRAFDSLNPRGRELYKEGITLSMSLQKVRAWPHYAAGEGEGAPRRAAPSSHLFFPSPHPFLPPLLLPYVSVRGAPRDGAD